MSNPNFDSRYAKTTDVATAIAAQAATDAGQYAMKSRTGSRPSGIDETTYNATDHGLVGDAVYGLSAISGNQLTVDSSLASAAAVGKAVMVQACGPLAATAAPSNVTAVAASGGTASAGTYYYAVTFVAGNGETAATRISVTLNANQKATISWSAASTGVLGVRIYRSATFGSEIFVGEVFGTNILNYTDTFSRTTVARNGQIVPPTVNTTHGSFIATISAVNGSILTLGSSVPFASMGTRTVNDATVGRTVTDATVSGTTLTSATASFTDFDLGAQVTVSSKTLPIIAIVSSTQVTLGDSPTSGSGLTASIVNSILTSSTANFTSTDIRKLITIGSTKVRVYQIISSTQVLIDKYLASPVTAGTQTVISGAMTWIGTDNSSALTTIKNDIGARTNALPPAYFPNLAVSSLEVVLPAGMYLVAGDNPLVSLQAGKLFQGFHLRGAGKYSTTIVAGTLNPGDCLIRTNDKHYHVVMEDLGFISVDAGLEFLRSPSNGNAANFEFNRVAWNGVWHRGVGLLPWTANPNTNSEMSFNRCEIHGGWTSAFLDIGLGTLMNLTGAWSLGQENQFLNYWFNDTQIEIAYGIGIRASRGGNISINNGSYFIDSPQSASSLVQLLGGGDQSGGIHRFSWRGSRVEIQRTPFIEMLYCEWLTGAVAIENVDTGGQVGLTANKTQNLWSFNNTTGSMPIISFRSMEMAGRIRFITSTVSWQNRREVLLDTIAFLHAETSTEAIVNETAAGAGLQAGQLVPVEMRNVRSSTGTALQTNDMTYNSATAAMTVTTQKVMKVNTANGGLSGTGSSTTFKVPDGVRLVRAVMTQPTTSSTNKNFNVTLADSGGNVILKASGSGSTSLGGGFIVWVDEVAGLGGTSGVNTTPSNLLPRDCAVFKSSTQLTLSSDSNYDYPHSDSLLTLYWL